MNIYIYTGNEFPSYTGKKVIITGENENKVQVKVLDERTFIEGNVWGIVFYCRQDDLEWISND